VRVYIGRDQPYQEQEVKQAGRDEMRRYMRDRGNRGAVEP